MTRDDGREPGLWIFIDRDAQRCIEEISRREAMALRRWARSHRIPYEIIEPDGTRQLWEP